jgi:putative FmdB family regulatory protein
MPTYEFVCKACGNKFDCRRPYEKADEPINCVLCNSSHTKRSLSRIFFHNEKGSINNQKSNCSGCSGGSCAACHH